MRIAMIGTGYVGLTTGTCLANLGNDVICVDIGREKIARLEKGELPFYEPGLRDLVEINVREKRLSFTTEIGSAINISDVIFIAVGTPEGSNGEANLSSVFSVAQAIGRAITGYKLVVIKSTVPIGTGERVRAIIKENLKSQVQFDLASNPEFLREGAAVNDFMIPDRVVIGVDSGKAKELLMDIYKGIERTGRPVMVTDPRSSELIKYASNAMLAARISFMNELSALCEKAGGDIKQIAKGMGLDSRIGPRFLQAGTGYGGSCFPKDVKALKHILDSLGCSSQMMTAIDEINERQKSSLVPKVVKMVGDARGRKIAVWGLAFKPKTDDLREAPSLVIISELQKLGAKITAFDPVAKENARKLLKGVEFAIDPYDAVKDASCLVIVTEWDQFRELDREKVKRLMKEPNIVDGRNIYEPSEMKAIGINYVGVGR
jgi:UDPglucose 6-dehydrogenase